MRVGVFALWILLRREVPWIRFGIRHAQWAVIRRLTGPALSFMSFPLVNALNLQGILVVIGYVMGPIAVVTFNTARTISRSAAQGMNLINNSIWPEMSAAFGMGAMDIARMLHRRACQISLLLCLGITLGVAFLGDWIWRVWTVGKVPTDPVLLNIMLLQMVVSAFWFTSSVVPMATNQHQRMARAMLAATCLALVLAWLLMHVPSLGLRGAAIALVAGDLFTAFYVLRESLRLLDDTPGRLCTQHAGSVAAAAAVEKTEGARRQREIAREYSSATGPECVFAGGDHPRKISGSGNRLYPSNPNCVLPSLMCPRIGPGLRCLPEKWSSHQQISRLRVDALLQPNLEQGWNRSAFVGNKSQPLKSGFVQAGRVFLAEKASIFPFDHAADNDLSVETAHARRHLRRDVLIQKKLEHLSVWPAFRH